MRPRYLGLTRDLKPIPRPRRHTPLRVRAHPNQPGREQALRRQPEFGGAAPAGSGRALRLDPLALPVRFTASDARADERIRYVELNRERVVLRRAVRGI